MADVTIGSATPAGYVLGATGLNEMYMAQFTLAGADPSAIVKKLRVRVRQTGAGTSNFRAYVYSTAGTLMASNDFTISGVTADSIVEATFVSGSTMVNGTYFLGTHEGSTGSGFGFGAITSGFTNGREKTSTYGSGIPTPLGTTNAQSTLTTAVEAVVGVALTTWNGSSTVSLTDTVTTAGARLAVTVHGATTTAMTATITTVSRAVTLHASTAVSETVTVTTRAALELMILVPRVPGSLVLVPRPPDSLVLTPR